MNVCDMSMSPLTGCGNILRDLPALGVICNYHGGHLIKFYVQNIEDFCSID